MQHKTFQDSIQSLEIIAKTNEAILVSFSGGKDSLACLDLCSKIFQNITCFFMYFIRDLDCIENQLQYARDRYKVEILQYPHWVLNKCLQDMVYGPSHNLDFKLKKNRLKDIYDQVRLDTGIEYIVTGAKKADSLWRRRYHANSGDTFENVIHPVWDWNKFDVLAYLKTNNIKLPDKSKANAAGIDLSTPSLLALYDNYPKDFEKLLEIFPYAMAVVKRREFYEID